MSNQITRASAMLNTLQQRAQQQTQANRYQFLRRVADAKLITQIANK